MSYSGSCQCGAVRFEIESDLTDIVYCHCSLCRKFSGSAFLAFGSAEHRNINIAGSEHIKSYSASKSASREFCSHCGSTLFWQELGSYGDKYKCVALGSLDGNFEPSSWEHYYTSCKASWYQIQDGQSQFDETS